MVRDGVQRLHGPQLLHYHGGLHAEHLRHLAPRLGQGGELVEVHGAREPRVPHEEVPVVLDLAGLLHLGEDGREGRVVGGRGALGDPAEPLQAGPHVDDRLLHLPVVRDVALERREDGVPELEAPDEVLEAVPEGPGGSGPDGLDERYLMLRDPELLRHEFEVQVDAPVLPVTFLVGDGGLPHHAERRVVLSAHPDARHVVEARAHLGDDQRVGGELEDHLAPLDPLEVDDRGHGKVAGPASSGSRWGTSRLMVWPFLTKKSSIVFQEET